jgi:iron complex outermembrane receptor protein
MCENVNTYSMPRWQGSLSADWLGTQWNAGGKLRVVGDYKDDGDGRFAGSCVYKPGRKKVNAFVTLDLQTGYSFDFGTTLSAGINNVADAEPPYTDEDGFPFYNKNLYNPHGTVLLLESYSPLLIGK